MIYLKFFVLFLLSLTVLSSKFGLGLRKSKNPPNKVQEQQADKQTDFKTELSHVMRDIKQLNTPQGIRLTAQLSNLIFSIHNILEQQYTRNKTISNNQNSDYNSRKMLEGYVKKLIQTIHKTKTYLSKEQIKSVNGISNIVIGENNLIDGKINKVKGIDNILIGENSLIFGDNNLLRGNFNNILGDDIFMMGNNNTAKGKDSIIFGFDNKSYQDNSMVVGKHSIDISQYRK